MNMMNFITWINYEDAFRTLSMLHITVVFATYPYEKEQVTFSLTIKFLLVSSKWSYSRTKEYIYNSDIM